jgi:hypothetical protein
MNLQCDGILKLNTTPYSGIQIVFSVHFIGADVSFAQIALTGVLLMLVIVVDPLCEFCAKL